MTTSQLVKDQKKVYGPRFYTENGTRYRVTATVRYDDQCGNGRNSFAITGKQERHERGRWEEDSCGCIHDIIAKQFPELAPFIKWHGMFSDGPMHYIANTAYHARENGPTYAWVYYTGTQDPLKIEEVNERLLGYEKAGIARKAEGQPGYRVRWDEKTAKTRNLDYARSTAIWPDATDEELTAPGLEDRLKARLPKLIEEFQQALKELGLTY